MTTRYPVVFSFLLALLLLTLMSPIAYAAAGKTTRENRRMAVNHVAVARTPAKVSKNASSRVAISYAGMVVTNACRCVKVQSRDSKSGPVYVQVCEGDGSNWM